MPEEAERRRVGGRTTEEAPPRHARKEKSMALRPKMRRGFCDIGFLFLLLLLLFSFGGVANLTEREWEVVTRTYKLALVQADEGNEHAAFNLILVMARQYITFSDEGRLSPEGHYFLGQLTAAINYCLATGEEPSLNPPTGPN